MEEEAEDDARAVWADWGENFCPCSICQAAAIRFPPPSTTQMTHSTSYCIRTRDRPPAVALQTRRVTAMVVLSSPQWPAPTPALLSLLSLPWATLASGIRCAPSPCRLRTGDYKGCEAALTPPDTVSALGC